MTPVVLTREDYFNLVRENERLRSALLLYSRDPHMFGTRGCATCQRITDLLAVPFGCVAKGA